MKNNNFRIMAVLFMIFALSIMGVMLNIGFGIGIPWLVITIPIWAPIMLITLVLLFVAWIHFMTLAFNKATGLIKSTKTTGKKANVNMIHPTIKTKESN